VPLTLKYIYFNIILCSSLDSLSSRTAHPTNRENDMTQLIRADTYGGSLTIITHVHSVDSHYDSSKSEAPTRPEFPFFILSEDETKDKFIESFKDSAKTHSGDNALSLFIIQRGSSLYFSLKQVEATFLKTLKETFGWAQDISMQYSLSEQFVFQRDVVSYKYPLMTAEAIVTNILSGELFPSKESLDRYNEYVAKMRSVKS
jgi:hypothetical protein